MSVFPFRMIVSSSSRLCGLEPQLSTKSHGQMRPPVPRITRLVGVALPSCSSQYSQDETDCDEHQATSSSIASILSNRQLQCRRQWAACYSYGLTDRLRSSKRVDLRSGSLRSSTVRISSKGYSRLKINGSKKTDGERTIRCTGPRKARL